MISKELLSEVLCIKYSFKIEDYNESNLNNLEWWQNEIYKEQMHTINIYELAHKCKEWAKNVYNNIDFMVYGRGQCDLTIFTQPDDIKYNFNADTEPEAIFKACQWILENKVSK